MNRRLKVFGLTLVAVLALSAVAAIAAQAETAIESELAAPAVTKLDPSNANSEHGKLARLTIGNGARFVECTKVDSTGTITGKATTIKATAEFTECFANNVTSSPVRFTHNQCTISLTVKKTARSRKPSNAYMVVRNRSKFISMKALKPRKKKNRCAHTTLFPRR